jgi:DeoR family transcriptional regulator of aga operon
MRKDERIRGIGELLRETEYASVDFLAEKLGVSAATIRRDLKELADQGSLRRTHGGAVLGGPSYEIPVRYRQRERAEEKRRIGRAAAALVGDGMIIGMTGGTTTSEVARAMPLRTSFTVVTNAVNIATTLAPRPNVRVVVTGGVARSASFELAGPIAESTLSRYHLDVVFLGVDGIDAAAGCTTHDDTEAMTNEIMTRQAERVIVVADSSKIGRRAFARICRVEDVSLLITDTSADDSAVAVLESKDVKVERV